MSVSNTQGTPITFFDSYKPKLTDGAYNIEVSQNIQITGNTAPTQPTPQNLAFHVSGPRFTLTPADIHSVYPPAGGKGDYRADLPKIVLNRSTLPWERFADAGTSNGSASWLFLLLVQQTDIDSRNVKESHNAAVAGLSSTFNRPITSDEQNRLPTAINYLTLDSTIQAYIPSTTSELAYCSYARIKESEAEQAVLIGNRLPEPGGK